MFIILWCLAFLIICLELLLYDILIKEVLSPHPQWLSKALPPKDLQPFRMPFATFGG